jgi:hypothetical protein
LHGKVLGCRCPSRSKRSGKYSTLRPADRGDESCHGQVLLRLAAEKIEHSRKVREDQEVRNVNDTG